MIVLIIIVSLSVLIFIHELGHFLTAKAFGVRVEEFGIGFPPRLWSKKKRETLYSVNALPFGGFVKIQGEDGEAAADERSFSRKNFFQKAGMLLAGVFMNFILGWLTLSVILMIGAPAHLMLTDVAAGSPAASAGIKSGDVVVRAAFNNIVLTDPIKSDDLVSLVKTAGDQQISLAVKRNGRVIDFNLAGRLNPPAGQGPLGVALADIGFKAEPFFSSFWDGLREAGQIAGMVFYGFVNLIEKIFVAPQVIQTLTGPVGIFSLAEQAGSVGLIYLFQLMALISVNLAVLNLLPFPALDGGRFLMLIVEKIKGSPISRKIQFAVNAAGFTALVILMIIVTIQDVHKFIK